MQELLRDTYITLGMQIGQGSYASQTNINLQMQPTSLSLYNISKTPTDRAALLYLQLLT